MRWLVTSLVLCTLGCSSSPEPYRNPKLPIEKRVDDLLPRLTETEKRDVVNGSPVHRFGIPDLRASSGTKLNATALAATWDPEIMASAAHAGAVLDVRDLGDDPWLASRMTVAWVSAMQGGGMLATLTGFPQTGGDVNPEDVTLNERLYPPFRAAVEEAGVWSIQAGPNAMPVLDDWGYKGFVVGAPLSDDQLRRRLRAMTGLGVFDPDQPPAAGDSGRKVVDESVVLLKNEHGLLPLAPTIAPLAVVGGQVPGLTAASDLTPNAAAVVVLSADPDLIRRATRITKNVVVVLDKAHLAEIGPWIDEVPAVLVAWGSNDIGRILLGQANPAGRLPLTTVRFPLGYGISYTTFAYSDLKIFPATPRYGQLVTVTVKVTNTGQRAGAEVVELYMNEPRQLKAFRRVQLNPGESRDVSFELDRHSMSFYDPLVHDWATKPGLFEVTVGSLRGKFQLFR